MTLDDQIKWIANHVIELKSRVDAGDGYTFGPSLGRNKAILSSLKRLKEIEVEIHRIKLNL